MSILYPKCVKCLRVFVVLWAAEIISHTTTKASFWLCTHFYYWRQRGGSGSDCGDRFVSGLARRDIRYPFMSTFARAIQVFTAARSCSFLSYTSTDISYWSLRYTVRQDGESCRTEEKRRTRRKSGSVAREKRPRFSRPLDRSSRRRALPLQDRRGRS